MSERSRVSLRAARIRVRINRMAETTEKPSTASAKVSAAISWRSSSSSVAHAFVSNELSCARAGELVASSIAPAPATPSRTSAVHDRKVRRITAITPDMLGPKPHDSTTGVPHRSRIDRQYPHRESAGKSPDRERKQGCEKMRRGLLLLHLIRLECSVLELRF